MIGYIYFISGPALCAGIKIGFSKNPIERLAIVQAQAAVKLHILASVPGTMEDEKTIHHALHHYRMCGEWFKTGLVVNRLVTKIIRTRRIPKRYLRDLALDEHDRCCSCSIHRTQKRIHGVQVWRDA